MRRTIGCGLSSVIGTFKDMVFGSRSTGELRIEVPALAHPEVGATIEIGAVRFALWAFAGPERTAV
jgi:hypothetical protein